MSLPVDPPDPAARPAEPTASGPGTALGRLLGAQSGAGLAVITGLAVIAIGVSSLIWIVASNQEPDRSSAAAAATPQLLEIEQLLGRLSFPPGQIDGIFDRDTGKAIEAYQQAAGLTIDGQPSAALLNELRDVAGL